MELSPPPLPPQGAKYALTVPQSVLFAELSLQGNLRSAFKAAMHIDYEPQYIIIDDGAMSWNYDSDDAFTSALLDGGSATEAIARFISTMETTTRNLDRISRLVPPRVNRRSGVLQDLIEDLDEYWQAYKLQMTSLFTFWNVEYLLSSTLTKALERIGRYEDIKQGLTRFLRPYESNYFVLERRQLEKLARRFVDGDSTTTSAVLTKAAASSSLVGALQSHSELFGFLLAPFNLGSPPSIEYLLKRLSETANSLSGDPNDSSLGAIGGDSLRDLPPDVRELGILAQRFTFWKSERLDMLSLGDARAQSLYQEAAAVLSLPLQEFFTLTSGEILDSLRQTSPVIDEEERKTRADAFCLLLHEGLIIFHRPSAKTEAQIETVGSVGTELKGMGASRGIATGEAKVIMSLEDLTQLGVGDVLVTTMTRPEMGTALDRASAFVTDEGGLMCHAAIISREMDKPCVIGTENATRIIRTGMTVEVNADQGLVKIVKVPS